MPRFRPIPAGDPVPASERLPVIPGKRGAQNQPANPYMAVHQEPAYEEVEHDADFLDSAARPRTQYFFDTSQTIVSENKSPDIRFSYSVNPYRGCSHGCAYCYARPTHEYLGLSAGLDFETKIFVKQHAGRLFREWLARPRYDPQPVAFSGVTDCYQPAEKKFRVTRQCMEVAAEHRQPITIVTKNALVTRDVDCFQTLAACNAITVAVSITTLDANFARVMEPQTSTPQARLRAISELIAAGVPVHLMVAPLIPGLNDSEAADILAAGKEAGAKTAGYVLLRLPGSVRHVFFDWLRTHRPNHVERVESFIRNAREGRLNSAQFGKRMQGDGIYAGQIRQLFEMSCKKLGLNQQPTKLDCSHFRRPDRGGQQRLFD